MEQPTHSIISAIPPYTPEAWRARRFFADTISDICREESINIEWLSDLWIARLEKAGQVKYIVSTSLPVNDGGARSIALDKAATYEILNRRGIPAITHLPVRLPDQPDPETIAQLSLACLALSNLPLVVKPLTESGGLDVYRATTQTELATHLLRLSNRYKMAALSPFENITVEYRAIMLGNECKYMFAKIRPVDHQGHLLEWRHNLLHGATAAPVTDQRLRRHIQALAQRAMAEIGLNYASVDIVDTPTGLKVLEVNSSGYISRHAAGNEIIRDCYQAALRLAFPPALS